MSEGNASGISRESTGHVRRNDADLPTATAGVVTPNGSELLASPRVGGFSEREGGILCSQCVNRSLLVGTGVSREALAFLQAVSKTDFRSAHHLSVSLLVKREVETILKDYIASILGRREGRYASF